MLTHAVLHLHVMRAVRPAPAERLLHRDWQAVAHRQ